MPPRPLKPMLNADEVNHFMNKAYPQLNAARNTYYAIDVFDGGCIVRLDADDHHLRPGNTVSGPALFALADIGGYVCVLTMPVRTRFQSPPISTSTLCARPKPVQSTPIAGF